MLRTGVDSPPLPPSPDAAGSERCDGTPGGAWTAAAAGREGSGSAGEEAGWEEVVHTGRAAGGRGPAAGRRIPGPNVSFGAATGDSQTGAGGVKQFGQSLHSIISSVFLTE